MAKPDASHFKLVANALVDGDVVSFLGAGITWCDRPAGSAFEIGTYLPDGKELSRDLVKKFGYPGAKQSDDEQHDPADQKDRELARVAQYVDLMAGRRTLHRRLREIFGASYQPSSLHKFFALLPKTLRDKQRLKRCPLIVTTNYDDLLERAFREAGEPLEVITFAPRAGRAGLFDISRNGGPAQAIDSPDALTLKLEERTVLLKIHGIVADESVYVITEDDYIDYLALDDVLAQLPPQLTERLRWSNFLFLGYGLSDWNIRALFRRLHLNQVHDVKSWAVQLHPDQFDELLWQSRDVFIYDIELKSYMSSLRAALDKV